MKMRLVIAGVFLGLIVGFLYPAVREAREAARACTCTCNIHHLQLALRMYESEKGNFPPAYVLGPDGKPWHSWRVLILPYLEEHEIYGKYRFDEPWNGPNNKRLADRIAPRGFQCPSGGDYETTSNTNYVLVVGKGTAFPDDKTTRLADISDGEANTLMVVEVGDAEIHWMEPRDLDVGSLKLGPSMPGAPAIGSPHSRGPHVVFADGRYERLQQPLRPETLRALATIAGGEDVTRDAIFAPDPGPMCFGDANGAAEAPKPAK